MIKKYKATSPGIRHRKSVVKDVTKSRPEKSLRKPLKGAAGRNNGKISSRHRERGHKKHYRVIDFKRNKHGIEAKVARIEHDPNRGANIALLHYLDGEKRYILAPHDLKKNSRVVSGPDAPVKVGNSMPLEKIPLGIEIHNLEINPGQGGQVVRGAGNSAVILAKEGNFVNVKLPSGEVKMFQKSCYATVGALSNPEKRHAKLGKAGRKRHLGKRPHIRGVAIANPKDHPHGGSYKDNGIGMSSPKSPWGWKTRGKKTRTRKHTDKYIVKDRRKK